MLTANEKDDKKPNSLWKTGLYPNLRASARSASLSSLPLMAFRLRWWPLRQPPLSAMWLGCWMEVVNV